MASSTQAPSRDPPPALHRLPSALILTIMSKLDVASIRSMASTCKALRSCAAHGLSCLPNFHLVDISPSMNVIRPLLSPENPHLRTVKVDCSRLNDSFLDILLRPSLQEVCLHNCDDFSGRLLSQIGQNCKELKVLYLSSLAEKRGRSVDGAHLEELLIGCRQLEMLILMFDVSIFVRHNFARVWAVASSNLTSLQVGYIPSVMVTELLSPAAGSHQSKDHVQPSILPNMQILGLAVDYITDTLVTTISNHLASLTHLDLRDSPVMEPLASFDLTNLGLQQINAHGRLKHLSLIRTHEIAPAYFRRVNDLGILLMADKCSAMESICLGGFCQVSDTGYKTILHSCSRLYEFRVYHGNHLTDLVFHDIAATSLSLTHVSMRWCNLLTNFGIARLTSNQHLSTLDLRDCRNLGDAALRAISTLPMLKTLLVGGCDISDAGLSYLSKGPMSTLVCLSLRGCNRLTDRCITYLFGNSSNSKLRELDLSNLANLSDAGILSLAKSRVPISELRVRHCPLIGDTSVMALASMQFDGNEWLGSTLKLLDLYNCGGVTQLSFKWLKRPYFPRLRWLGVTEPVNRDVVDALARSRQNLHVCTRGNEIGNYKWGDLDDTVVQDFEEVDELEQWLHEEDMSESDDEMGDASDMDEYSD